MNLDAEAYGNFIALTDDGRLIANDGSLQMDREVRYPIIRRLDADTFFIADGRAGTSDNVQVYNFKGEKINSFFAGDGIEDIVVHNGRIVIAYFDEGVMGKAGPNNDGVSVFDNEGRQLFGFNSMGSFGHLVDCYCLCSNDRSKVLFYAYPELQVYKLNLESFKVEVYDTPQDFTELPRAEALCEKAPMDIGASNLISNV